MALLTLCAFLVVCRSLAQTIAVYQSSTNDREYHGIYQEPLRTWLTRGGHEFTLIDDAAASDPEQLSRFSVILASSVYLVPDAAAQGLADYVARGGGLLWIDSPARCHHPGLRAALGLGPRTTYTTLSDCKLTMKVPTHPAAITVPEFTSSHLVGNCAVEAASVATVLYEMSATRGEGRVSLPAVILSRHGKGVGLCYNWIVWINREPQAQAILTDGLDYLLARQAAAAGPHVRCTTPCPTVRQPAPVPVVCKVYQPAQASRQAASCEVSLLAPDSQTPLKVFPTPLDWSHADDALTAAVARLEVPTEGLSDGTYLVQCRANIGGAEVQAKEVTVTLDGDRWAALRQQEVERHQVLARRLQGTLGDYDAEPRTADGRVDIPRLLQQIETAHMTMYDWLIWHAATDWQDLQAFLPAAKERGIQVWVTLCPPSEQGGRWPWSEPYRLDFIKWAEEIGKLSRQYDNLAALVIDDFWSGGNASLFTPNYIAELAVTLRAQNPAVAFLPTVYWATVGDQQFLADFGPAMDGIVFPYTELETGDDLANQLRACRQWIGPHKLLMVNIYASGSGGAPEKGPRTPEYMRTVLAVARELSDGIRMYCLPKGRLLEDYRYAITAELYGQWRKSTPQP